MHDAGTYVYSSPSILQVRGTTNKNTQGYDCVVENKIKNIKAGRRKVGNAFTKTWPFVQQNRGRFFVWRTTWAQEPL
jgi:hypothetical protein